MRNELRYGNLVLLRGNVSRVIEILFDEVQIHVIDEKDYAYQRYRDLSPIPLTEKVVEACGFERREIHEYYYYENGKIILLDFEDYFYCDMLDQNLIETPFRSLHQLQNFYFLLTGTELQIDNEKLNEAVK